MGTWEHPPETVALAEEKYCVDRLSLSAIGRDLGVHRNTLAKWRDLYGWDATRVELAQALATIRVNKIKARAKLLKSLLDDPDPQMGFAVSSLETLALKEIEMTRAGQLAETAPAKRVPVNSPDQAADRLQEALEIKFGRLLDDPAGLDFKTVKDIKQSMDMLSSLRTRVEDTGSPGVDGEDVDRMIEAMSE